VTTFDINGGSTFSPFTIRVTAATVDATTVGTTNKGAWWLYLVIVKNGTAGTVTLLDSGGDTGSFTAPVLAGDSATGHQTWTCTTVGTRNRLIQGVEIINYTGGNGVSS
jgi:acyl dehydratase